MKALKSVLKEVMDEEARETEKSLKMYEAEFASPVDKLVLSEEKNVFLTMSSRQNDAEKSALLSENNKLHCELNSYAPKNKCR